MRSRAFCHAAPAMLLSFAGLQSPAVAQTIEVGELGAADEFSAGVLDLASGGLDANAWSATGAAQAVELVQDLPLEFGNPVAEDLMRAALLSEGIPPEGSEELQAAYRNARTDYLFAIGDVDTVARLAERDLALSRDRAFQVKLALEQGRLDAACQATQGAQSASEAFWMKARAFCFAREGNLAGADLTAELLGDAAFSEQLQAFIEGKPLDVVRETALQRAMAAASAEDGEATTDPFEDLGESDIETFLPMAKTAGGEFADIYISAVEMRDAQAAADFLRAMDATGRFADASNHFAPLLQTLPASEAVEAGLNVFVRSAVIEGDGGTLAGLFSALEPGTDESERVAIIADALGGGFRYQPVGAALEMFMMDGGDDAVADILLATALGGELSPAARLALGNLDITYASGGEWLALELSARAGARSETALRAAALLERDSLAAPDLARIVAALEAAGLSSFAGRVAAWDMASRL